MTKDNCRRAAGKFVGHFPLPLGTASWRPWMGEGGSGICPKAGRRPSVCLQLKEVFSPIYLFILGHATQACGI